MFCLLIAKDKTFFSGSPTQLCSQKILPGLISYLPPNVSYYAKYNNKSQLRGQLCVPLAEYKVLIDYGHCCLLLLLLQLQYTDDDHDNKTTNRMEQQINDSMLV